MVLNSLSIMNYKNIAEATLDFSSKVNCLLGNNGMGKTNILDAIYYLSFCKNSTGRTDANTVRYGEEFMLLLDDIFDKLDSCRVANIMRIVSDQAFGQIFISDTNREHLDETIRTIGSDYRIFMVENGRCKPFEGQ